MEVVRNTKIADVLGTHDYKEHGHSNRERRSSRHSGGGGGGGDYRNHGNRRDSLDSVSYDKGLGNGDEVSIQGVEWSGDGVSMSMVDGATDT